MDGDCPDLQALVEIKRRHGAWLMIDDAHGLGVLGATGAGIHELCRVAPTDVDIWMGTLSKTLSGCGGYISGCRTLVEYLKCMSGGFVYSVGLPPPIAAAALEALEAMRNEPDRVARLQRNAALFWTQAKGRKLDVGSSEGPCHRAGRGALVSRSRNPEPEAVRTRHKRAADHPPGRAGAPRAAALFSLERAYGRADRSSRPGGERLRGQHRHIRLRAELDELDASRGTHKTLERDGCAPP